MSSHSPVDTVRPDTVRPSPDPPPQIRNRPLDVIHLSPDPIIAGLQMANCIWLAVNGGGGK